MKRDMGAAFTPGPWTLDATRYRDGYGTRQNVLDAQGRVVLSVPSDRAFATTEANARLIVAAPELYEALDKLIEVCIEQNFAVGPHGRVAIGMDALRKARSDQ